MCVCVVLSNELDIRAVHQFLNQHPDFMMGMFVSCVCLCVVVVLCNANYIHKLNGNWILWNNKRGKDVQI